MECPHCHMEIPGIECPHCGVMVPEESRFCMNCGAHFIDRSDETIDEEDGFDPEERVLCSDGTCTGIIVNGICTECGKPSQHS